MDLRSRTRLAEPFKMTPVGSIKLSVVLVLFSCFSASINCSKGESSSSALIGKLFENKKKKTLFINSVNGVKLLKECLLTVRKLETIQFLEKHYDTSIQQIRIEAGGYLYIDDAIIKKDDYELYMYLRSNGFEVAPHSAAIALENKCSKISPGLLKKHFDDDLKMKKMREYDEALRRERDEEDERDRAEEEANYRADSDRYDEYRDDSDNDYYKLKNSVKNFYMPLKIKLKSMSDSDSDSSYSDSSDSELSEISPSEYSLILFLTFIFKLK